LVDATGGPKLVHCVSVCIKSAASLLDR